MRPRWIRTRLRRFPDGILCSKHFSASETKTGALWVSVLCFSSSLTWDKCCVKLQVQVLIKVQFQRTQRLWAHSVRGKTETWSIRFTWDPSHLLMSCTDANARTRTRNRAGHTQLFLTLTLQLRGRVSEEDSERSTERWESAETKFWEVSEKMGRIIIWFYNLTLNFIIILAGL